jgi:hypothetical protein
MMSRAFWSSIWLVSLPAVLVHQPPVSPAELGEASSQNPSPPAEDSSVAPDLETLADYEKYARAAVQEVEQNFDFYNRMVPVDGVPGIAEGSCTSFASEPDEEAFYSQHPEERENRDYSQTMLWNARYWGAIRVTLRRYLYPMDAFEPILQRAERNALGGGGGGNWREEFEGVRQRVAPQLPRLNGVGDCDGFESPAFMRSNPPGAQIWVISHLSFLRCRLDVPNPWNTERCIRWVRALARQRLSLIGNYMYQARWPNGRRASGRLTAPGGEDVATYTVTPD